MAEGIAFNLVKGVLGKLGSALSDEIGLLWGFKDDVRDLASNLSAIQAVLLDAEERSSAWTEKETHALRDWLGKLKDAAYDADDLLDKIRTRALLREQQYREAQDQSQPAEKVREFLSRANPMHLKFKLEMARRMKALREKIDKIAKQRRDFGLVEAGPLRQAEFKRLRSETFSLVDVKKIVGRDDDREKIVKLLLETNGDHDVSVIPIVGLGGLGKTTLAQLAFNDGRVEGQQRFDLRVWVCVSTDFHMKKIARPVMSAAGEKCDDLDNMDATARCLGRIFSQKRFLLVLDDVWNEDQNKWEDLKVVFKDGKKGSKIVVTTRSQKVAKIMKTVEPHRVKRLSDDDCWTLVKRRAFKEGEENDYPSLVEIGKQMVKKCGGLPLAANALGGLMDSESRTDDAWSAIRDSEIWKEEKTVLPSLKLSYIRMPSALKQCFAYCSIFPKDYEIDKDDLIQQWIALGFIPSHETRTLIEDGNKYFNDLLWISFLQDVKGDEKCYGSVTCRMHDLVHDLAQSVARKEVAVIGGEESRRIPEGCRYVSTYGLLRPQDSSTVIRRLRALQLRKSDSLTMTFLGQAKYLRLLDLHGSNIRMLRRSIGKLKLLRYLDLSGTNIQELPESITGLYNLQTLNLSGCSKIRTLPKSLGRLQNLRILNLSNCYSLTIFDSVSSLQNLYALNLSFCEKVISVESVCHLKNLRYLDLSYLNSLVTLPKSIGSLQKLRILNLSHCHSLLSLPSWLSDLQYLQKLDITYCRKLCELPKMIQKLTKLRELLNGHCWDLKGMPRGIGKLVNLQQLQLFVVGKQGGVDHYASISELERLKLVGELEIKGLENVTDPADANVANLIEKNLRSLKLEWNVLSAAKGTDTVPSAQETDCVLENLQPCQSLERLEIKGYAGGEFPSWMMKNGIDSSCLPNLVEMELGNMPAIKNLGAGKFPAMRRLCLKRMRALREWVTVLTVDDREGRRERVPTFPRLTSLILDECPQLRPEPCLPTSVEQLNIYRTSKENLSLILERARMESETRPLDDGDGAVSPLQLPPNKGLRNLSISECQRLTCLPESLRSLTSLQSLTIRDCNDLQIIEDWLGELTDLRTLDIPGCRRLYYLPTGKMTTLEMLSIWDCPLLYTEARHFVNTRVDHIKEVFVDGRRCPKQGTSKQGTSKQLYRGWAERTEGGGEEEWDSLLVMLESLIAKIA